MKKLREFSVIYLLRRKKIFGRLLFMFILATLLPITFFAIWSYRRNSIVIQEKVFVSVNEILNQITGAMNQKVEKIRNDSIEISYMSEIQHVLSDYDSMNHRERNQAKLDIMTEMSRKYVFDNVVSGIILYTLDGQRMDAYGPEVENVELKEPYLKDFLDICYSRNGKCVFLAVNQAEEERRSVIYRDKVLIVGKAVKHNKTGNIIGYSLLQIEESQFSDIYKELTYSMGAKALVLDEEGTVISTAGGYAEVGEGYPSEKTRRQLLQSDEHSEDFQEIWISNEKMGMLSKKMEANGWQVFFLIPYRHLQEEVSTVFMNFLMIAMVCIVFGIIVTFIFSRSIIGPLGQVVDGMEEFEKGNLSVVLNETGADEITKLSAQFNKMTKEINSLMEQEKNSEKEKRKLEIQALQAQINPHFLANTLNTASYIARIRHEEIVGNLLNATINLLRASMKNDDSFHSVEEEMESIKSYVTIQEYRLLGKFNMEIQLEPEIEKYQMPRFILQPVVENAIIHGIEPLKKRGVVTLKGYQDGKELVFEITDNGIGMTEEQITGILQEKKNVKKSRFSGVGIGNVNKRIQLLMGKEYGLTIISEKDKYTTVFVKLPVQEKE